MHAVGAASLAEALSRPARGEYLIEREPFPGRRDALAGQGQEDPAQMRVSLQPDVMQRIGRSKREASGPDPE
jgi:hypothetical protein